MSSGEDDKADGERATPRGGLWVDGRLKGCRRGLGLRPPSESLLWLLGGVGGRCSWSAAAAAEEQNHQSAGFEGMLNQPHWVGRFGVRSEGLLLNTSVRLMRSTESAGVKA